MTLWPVQKSWWILFFQGPWKIYSWNFNVRRNKPSFNQSLTVTYHSFLSQAMVYFSQINIHLSCRFYLFIYYYIFSNSHSHGNWTAVVGAGFGKWNCHCSIKNNQFDESCIYSHTQSNVILIRHSDLVLLSCNRMIIGFWQIPAQSLIPPTSIAARPPLLFPSTGAKGLNSRSTLQTDVVSVNTLRQSRS